MVKNKVSPNVFDFIEVSVKQAKKKFAEALSKAKMYFDVERKKYMFDTSKFILFHGILLNLVLYLFLGIDLSVLNVLASGATYYLLTDVVDLLSTNEFILFARRLK